MIERDLPEGESPQSTFHYPASLELSLQTVEVGVGKEEEKCWNHSSMEEHLAGAVGSTPGHIILEWERGGWEKS